MDTDIQMGLLQVLPNELVSIILAMLGYRDLASCMQVRGLFFFLPEWLPRLRLFTTLDPQVCKSMRHLIGISSLLQYHLELGKSCMEDGPLTLSRMSISERREKLQAHIKAWRNLQWTDCVHLFDTNFYEFDIHVAPGGIIVLRWRTNLKLTFIQPPSNTRGIPMRQWEHSFPFHVHDSTFALDPHEDILVLLERER